MKWIYGVIALFIHFRYQYSWLMAHGSWYFVSLGKVRPQVQVASTRQLTKVYGRKQTHSYPISKWLRFARYEGEGERSWVLFT